LRKPTPPHGIEIRADRFVKISLYDFRNIEIFAYWTGAESGRFLTQPALVRPQAKRVERRRIAPLVAAILLNP
jgi:hypothetical protein